jgi:cobalt-zinc-cadmium efflux system membrane fusion protein
MTHTRQFLSALLLAAVTACRENGQSTSRASADSAMQGMPGMNDSAAVDSASSPRQVMITAEQVRHGQIRWAAAVAGTGTEVTVVPARLTPDEDRTARLGAPVGGRILAVQVRPGDRVAAGRVLVTMQSPEASAVQSAVSQARAEVISRQAQATYAAAARARAQRLLDLRAIPRQDVERAVADDELARAGLEQANAELRRAMNTAGQLGVSSDPGAPAGQIALRAPLAGVVLSRDAVPGAVVDAGAPLVVVSDASRLWLIIDAAETLASSFQRARSLRFTVPAFPADTFIAQIDAIGAGLEPATRTLSVRATVASFGGRLKPEMLASVIVTKEGASALVVPESAVQLLDGKPVVFVAMPNADGGVHCMVRDVVPGPRGGGRVAIASGLAAGEIVITDGALAVKAQLTRGTGGMEM